MSSWSDAMACPAGGMCTAGCIMRGDCEAAMVDPDRRYGKRSLKWTPGAVDRRMTVFPEAIGACASENVSSLKW